MALMIHPVHRKLAQLTLMTMQPDGTSSMGLNELKLIIPLLKENLKLVTMTDGLKNIALEAQVLGDMEWVQEITMKLDEMEAQCT